MIVVEVSSITLFEFWRMVNWCEERFGRRGVDWLASAKATGNGDARVNVNFIFSAPEDHVFFTMVWR